ncbi:sodium-dependent transporter [Myxococcota bacterium]|nr:sodium-dependent transporter [Myxococcota bacterium]
MSDRGTFGRMGFIMAAAGSAIGLGNIWKFPYITYANEGGSFVLIYLLAVVLIGAPVMAAEILLGRRSQKSPVGAFLALAKEVKGGKLWSAVGWIGIIAGLVILSYYSVVAGWTLYYIYQTLQWSFTGFTAADATNLGQTFGNFVANGTMQVSLHLVFMIATVGTVFWGVKTGIERVTTILMPTLFSILVLLAIAVTFAPGFGEAISFLFHVGPITPDAVLEAVGQAFFSLSLGMGAMITYGSYVSKNDSIPKATAMVVALDTLIALIACVIMFSIIFSVPAIERGDTFSASAAILFTTLPRLFYQLPGGVVLAPVFYLLIAFAALTSTISLLEVVVAYFIDELKWARKKAAIIVGGVVFLLGVPSALSLGANEALSKFAPFGKVSSGFFDTFDYLAANWLLPVGGLFISIFTGWVVSTTLSRDEFELGHGSAVKLHMAWIWMLRVVAPVAIIWIIYSVIGGKSFA